MSLPDFSTFRPHPLLRGGHAQTILGVYLSGLRTVYQAERHFIELDDGDQLVLHDDCPPQWCSGQRAALLVHGLGGCHGSPYMARVAQRLSERGVRAFRLDLRGWGAGAEFARQPFHAARTGDIAAALYVLREKLPGSPVSLIGFSLGANIVLRLLGEAAGTPPPNVDSALAVAPPIDLLHCCQMLSRGLSKMYDRHYARYLWNHLNGRADLVSGYSAGKGQGRPTRIYDFDARFTAPLGGFRSVEHYYESASAAPLLSQIAVPTCILTAADDPIIPVDMFHDIAISDQVKLQITDHGGHLGYIGVAGVDVDRRWLDWRVVDWVLWQSERRKSAACYANGADPPNGRTNSTNASSWHSE